MRKDKNFHVSIYTRVKDRTFISRNLYHMDVRKYWNKPVSLNETDKQKYSFPSERKGKLNINHMHEGNMFLQDKYEDQQVNPQTDHSDRSFWLKSPA